MPGVPSADSLLQDLRYGTRLLRRSPGFTAVAIVSLAMGIGTAAAVFSLADAVLLRELPVRDPGNLALMRWSSTSRAHYQSLDGIGGTRPDGSASTSVSLAVFRAMRDRGTRAGQVIGFAELGRTSVVIDGRAELLDAQVVSGNYFDVLGIAPRAGRLIAAHDDRPSAAPTVVISHALWERRFAGDEGTIGRTVAVNGAPFTVIGVMPRGFNGAGQIGYAPDILLPFAFRAAVRPGEEPPDDPSYWWVVPMVRLAPGVGLDAARGAFDLILRQTVAAANPRLAPDELPRLALEPGSHGSMERRNGMRQSVRIMALVVVVVLLAACANVASLMLARGRARRHEMTVRAAIGAPRWRLVRQLVTEGTMLALGGSAAGLLFAQWLASALLPALSSSSAPLAMDLRMDPRTLGFTAILAAACTLAFALVPALTSSDVRLSAALGEGGRAAAGRQHHAPLASGLVVAQVGLCLLLLATAGLLVRSVRNLQSAPLGFEPQNVLLLRVAPVLNGYAGERLRAFYSEALERLSAVPGVESATLMSYAFMSGSRSTSLILAPGEEPTPEIQDDPARLGYRQVVSETFFTTLGVRLVHGRGFTRAEGGPSSVQSVVVNQTLARRRFPDADPIGQHFVMSSQPGAPVFEIVGVAADARHAGLREAPPNTIYHHYRDQARGQATFAVKTAGDPARLAAALSAALAAVDPNVPSYEVRTQEAQVLEAMRTERLFARLAVLLGAIVVLLGAVGLYGVVSYSVQRRTPEIGVRMALGAERGRVQRMVLRESLVLGGAGVAVGVPLALAGTRVIEAMLFGLEPSDPATIAGASAVLLLVALAAAYVPSRRAARVDPVVALRAE